MGLRNNAIRFSVIIPMVLAASGCGAVGNFLGIGNADVATSGTATGTRVSLLDDYLGALWGTNLSPEEQARRTYEESLRREELIAQCMADAGFEYQVVTPMEQGVIGPNADEIFRPEVREFVEEYGYAAIRSPWDSIIAASLTEPEPANLDPNQAFVESLSDAERQAYNDALWGPQLDFVGDVAEAESQLTTAERLEMLGCWGWAQGQVRPHDPSELYQADEFVPLFEAMNDLYNNLYQSPDFMAATSDWAACMADAGYPGFTHVNDSQQLFFDELGDFYAAWDWDHGSPTLENSPELQALHQREITLALLDLECRESSNLIARQNAATTAAEQQFINDHRSTLEALRSAAEQMQQ